MTVMLVVPMTIPCEPESMVTNAIVNRMVIDDLKMVTVAQTVAKMTDETVDRMANRIGDSRMDIIMAVDGTITDTVATALTVTTIHLDRAADIDTRDNWIVLLFERASVHKSLSDQELAMGMYADAMIFNRGQNVNFIYFFFVFDVGSSVRCNASLIKRELSEIMNSIEMLH